MFVLEPGRIDQGPETEAAIYPDSLAWDAVKISGHTEIDWKFGMSLIQMPDTYTNASILYAPPVIIDPGPK